MSAFAGKRVMVVGGSRGIGAAIVEQFCEQGASVLFTYVGSRAAAEALAARTKAAAVRSDAADRKDLVAAIEAAGALDVFVYNAGLLEVGDPLALDAEAVERLIDVNIRGAYFGAVEAARKMNAGGRIIIIGSVNGDRIPFQGLAAYAMSKSAVQGIARGLARDFGGRGITVNVVQPGPVDTDMNPADGAFSDAMRGVMAIPKYGTAAEVAALVLFLASPPARGITGAMHTIDGGFGA